MIDGRYSEQGAIEMEAGHPLSISSDCSRRELFRPLLHDGALDRTSWSVGEIVLLGENQRVDGTEEIIQCAEQMRIGPNRRLIKELCDSGDKTSQCLVRSVRAIDT